MRETVLFEVEYPIHFITGYTETSVMGGASFGTAAFGLIILYEDPKTEKAMMRQIPSTAVSELVSFTDTKPNHVVFQKVEVDHLLSNPTTEWRLKKVCLHREQPNKP